MSPPTIIITGGGDSFIRHSNHLRPQQRLEIDYLPLLGYTSFMFSGYFFSKSNCQLPVYMSFLPIYHLPQNILKEIYLYINLLEKNEKVHSLQNLQSHFLQSDFFQSHLTILRNLQKCATVIYLRKYCYR